MRFILLMLLYLFALSTIHARFCEETRDCDPLFICVDQECICRFGQTPCRPPLFGFAPLNALPRFHQDLSQRPYNFQ